LKLLGNSADNKTEQADKGRRERLFDAVNAASEVCGGHMSGLAILQMVTDLWEYSDEQIFGALKRCRAEIKPERGFVTFSLAIVLEKMGVVVGDDRTKSDAMKTWEGLASTFYVADGCDFHSVRVDKLEEILQGLPVGIVKVWKLVGGYHRVEHTPIGELHFMQSDFIKACELRGKCGELEEEDLDKLPSADSPVGQLIGELSAERSPADRGAEGRHRAGQGRGARGMGRLGEQAESRRGRRAEAEHRGRDSASAPSARGVESEEATAATPEFPSKADKCGN